MYYVYKYGNQLPIESIIRFFVNKGKTLNTKKYRIIDEFGLI